MKTLLAPALALLGNRLAMAQLVELQLTVPVYVADCRDTIPWNGNDYVGNRQTGISSIQDQGGEVVGLSFQISGVKPEHIAIALSEPIQGKRVIVRTAIMDPDTQVIVDVIQSWSGTLDQMPIKMSNNTASVGVTAEHRGITFARPKGIRYTDADQQKLFPGDKCLEFIVKQATHQDVWPAAAFFRQ